MSKTIIEAGGPGFQMRWKELWQYRELLWMLAWRDFRVKYAQTFLGLSWAILNPLLTLLILTFVFGTVVGVDTGDIPHPVYTLAGMCGWTYFSALTASAGGSIISYQQIVKKIYFPRLLIPLSKAITCFIDFAVILLCLALLMLLYGVSPSGNLLYLPLFILMALLAGLSAGIWMSALTIRFRDFQHITPLLLRLGLYATPIAYPASAVPEAYQMIFFLNPLAGIVEGMRWSLLGGDALPSHTYLSFAVVLLLFVSSIFYFHKVERSMADIL
ncbi:MAG: ABC transporter permease [Bacteroidota bacterium]